MNIKNIKTKIVLSVIISLGFIGSVSAASSSLYISPTVLTKTAGDTFNVSVGANAQGNKVCAVEGTLVFNNLTCQSITVPSDVMAQNSPTCTNPHYLIGIPGCTVTDKTILTVTVKAGTAGNASLSQTSVDIIGEGASLGSSSTSGNYTINSVPAVAAPKTTTPTAPTEVVSPEPETLQPVQTPTTPTNPESVNPGQASLASTGFKFNDYLWMGLIFILVIVLGYGMYSLIKKGKKQN